jgi:hypothetical protein
MVLTINHSWQGLTWQVMASLYNSMVLTSNPNQPGFSFLLTLGKVGLAVLTVIKSDRLPLETAVINSTVTPIHRYKLLVGRQA